MKLKRNQPEDEGNPVTGWHVGEEKQPTYDGFRFADSRRIPRDLIDEAKYCAAQVAWNRRDRAFTAARLAATGGNLRSWWPGKAIRLYDLFTAEDAKEASLDPALPSLSSVEFTVYSDRRLEGEAAADALGLDSEWREILNLPPVRCGPCTRWECRECAGEVPVGGYRVPCGCMDCEEGSE